MLENCEKLLSWKIKSFPKGLSTTLFFLSLLTSILADAESITSISKIHKIKKFQEENRLC